MTYDGTRNLILLWGGLGGQDPCDLLSDTWTWNGLSWTRQNPSGSPPPANYPNIAYDATHGLVVLFIVGQTWTWDGVTWMQRHPSVSPPARGDGAMVFDAGTGKIVLFSGISTPNDTWSWDGTTWTKQTPSTAPLGRWQAAATYDANTQTFFVFGGQPYSGPDFNDTWTY